ncbi:MAG: hypothetical protein JEY96_18135 [Bacteroidales bacterium]|nr:hypothetical protein [Bacteroidales bacterium]
MNKSKKIILVPHCFTTKGFAPQHREDIDEVLQVLLNYEAGIIQMPCPHLIFLQEKSNHNKAFKIKESLIDSNKLQDLNYLYSKHLNSYLIQIDEYKKQGFEIAGLIGVRRSPTCALKIGGEKHEQGVFMDIVKQRLEDKNIHTCTANIDIPLGNDKTYK